MQDQDDLTPAQRELELALATVPPTAARLDPTSAAFAAGRRSARRQLRRWQSAAAATLLLAVGSHLLPTHNPAAPPTDSLVVLQSTPPPTERPFSNQSVLMLQEAVRTKGIDGLSATYVPEPHPIRPGDNL